MVEPGHIHPPARTCMDLSMATGTPVDTLRKRLYRQFGQTPNAMAVLSQEQMVYLATYPGQAKRSRPRTETETQTEVHINGYGQEEEVSIRTTKGNTVKSLGAYKEPQPPAKTFAGVAVEEPAPAGGTVKHGAGWNALLDIIVWLELATVFVGCMLLMGWLAILPGAAAVLYYLHSLHTVKQSTAWSSAELSLWICTVLSIGFCWVHGQTFYLALASTRPDLDGLAIVARTLAVVLSGLSVMSLVQYRTVKKEEAAAC